MVHFFENFPFPAAGSGDFPALTGMDKIYINIQKDK